MKWSDEMKSDCCKAEVEPFLSFRMRDEGWYCTECGEPCMPVIEKPQVDKEVVK